MNPNSLKNLRPFDTKTGRQAGLIGGVKSAEARRKKKTMSEIAGKIASADIKDPKLRSQLQAQYGLEEEELINNSLVTARVFQEAVNGSMRAIEKWQEISQAGNEDETVYEIPARAIGKAFVDINRNIRPNVKYVFKGGRGGLKSSYISLKIIELLKNNMNVHACVIRKVGATLKDSVYAQIQWAVNELGLSDEFEFMKSPLEVIYKKTGQKIYFRGSDDPVKLKSIKPEFGYIGILWKEEWDQFAGPSEDRSINQSVLRGGDVAYEFCSFNPPRSKENWVNKQELEADDRRVFHSSSYLEAPKEWLGKRFIDDAEHLKEVNPQAYEHEYLGIANGDGGSVFEFLDLREITDEEIKNMDRLYAGVDWGYYPDPYAFILCSYDPARERVYIIDEFYENKLKNSDTAEWIKYNHAELLETDILQYGIICDSAEQKSIVDYQDLGIWNAKSAYKPPGSVSYGMKWLCGKTIVIDRNRTPNAFREITAYEYERDKDGNVISGYPDADNHTIDALRYALSPVFMRHFHSA